MSTLVALSIRVDWHNTSRYAIHIVQPTLNLRRYEYLSKASPTMLKRYVNLFVQIMSRWFTCHLCMTFQSSSCLSYVCRLVHLSFSSSRQHRFMEYAQIPVFCRWCMCGPCSYSHSVPSCLILTTYSHSVPSCLILSTYSHSVPSYLILATYPHSFCQSSFSHRVLSCLGNFSH